MDGLLGGYYDGDTYVAVLYNTNDGGINWYYQNLNIYNGVLNSVYFVNKDAGFIAGRSPDGSIFKTTDGGEDWVVKIDTGYYNIGSIFFIYEFTGWAVGIGRNGLSD